MFIELTDHLRCPEEHEEQFLVLLPERVEKRWVAAGELGCPVCGRVYPLRDGAFVFGESPIAPASSAELTPDAIAALSGLAGPGGTAIVVGGPAAQWRELSEVWEGVSIVAVNPPDAVADRPGVSVVRGGRIPLRAHSVRTVVLGEGFGSDPGWAAEAARVLLPGLRVVGAGEPPDVESIELLANAGRVWVGTRSRGSYRPPGSRG